ncbi:hypothetical protein, partial [Brevibacillus parabrevis]|uniref:hypothetical protein n=3 Tax=Brevibacillus TaxID=55080 RepID=UPI003D233C87
PLLLDWIKSPGSMVQYLVICMIVECSGMENGKKSMEGSMGGTRFWEFYLVRYLLGTIFGIVILFYLVINYDGLITKAFYPKPDFLCAECDVAGCQSIKKDIESLLFSTTYGLKAGDANDILKVLGSSYSIEPQSRYIEIKETGFPILAAIILAVSGFLFMYFSSMLILILHGLRAMLFFRLQTDKRTPGLTFLSVWQAMLIVSLIITLGVANKSWPDLKHFFTVLSLITFYMFVALSGPFIREFYKALSLSRTKKSWRHSNETEHTERTDYTESYKHLREHGNAFGIIVCEIIFAMWLVYWDFSYWAIFYWCCAGFLSWFLGSYIEVARVNDGD